MGRSKEGIPLAPANAGPGAEPNYEQDLDGLQCPFSAHIRKANPRRTKAVAFIRLPLFRRGAPWKDGENEGMHFLAFQSNIREVFGFMMQNWMNDPNFPQPGAGVDALLGPGQPFVNMMGGEFFFAPSMAFFKQWDASLPI
jgi:deferrochelatase/peroxidase EfeB